MTRFPRPRSTRLAATRALTPAVLSLLASLLAACGGGTLATDGEDAGDAGADAMAAPSDSGIDLDSTLPESGTEDAAQRDARSEDVAEKDVALEDAPASPGPDSGQVGPDAGSADAGQDANGEAGLDAGLAVRDAGADAAPEAASPPSCSPTCPDGNACNVPGDCASGVCANGQCASPACGPTCGQGSRCGASGDCASDICAAGVCAPPPSCSPGCPDGNACGVDADCASSACKSGTCTASIPCGNVCPANTTCIGEALPLANEGQTCTMTCAPGSQIVTISDVYATNCKPSACPSAVISCPNSASCDVTLSNGICGFDPCVGTPKSWSVTITCN